MAENTGASGSGSAPPQNPPERSLKLKISKRAYVFDVRKKFAATRSFAVRKKAETPADDIRDSLQSFLKARKPLSGGEKAGGAQAAQNAPGQSAPGQPPAAAAARPQGSLGIVVKIAAAVFILFFLAIGAIFMMYGGAQGGVPPSAEPSGFSGAYSASLDQGSILSVGQVSDPSRLAYFLIGFESQNVTEANFSAQLFREKPLTQVFILDHARESADMYPLFHSYLSERLSRQGISANEIGLESLPALPEGALLLVPTGYFPLELLAGDEGSNFKSLLSRGVDIVYIGMPFDTLALDRSGSTVKVANSDISFAKGRSDSSGGFLLYDAQYTASPGKAAGMSSQGMLYGSVSAVRLGKGSMLFIPQFLDGGWVTDSDSQGFEKAADDVSRLIYEERWLAPIASASAYTAMNSTSGRVPLSLYTTPFPDDSAFVRLSTTAADANGVLSRTFSIFQVEKSQKGEIYPRDPLAVPFYLSGVKTRLNLALKESNPAPVKLFVGMYKDGAELQRSEFELGLTNPTIEKSVDFQVNAEPGNYVLAIIDGSGKVYAATQLTVTDLDIALSHADWVNGKFNFTISAGGRLVSPQSLSVSMDKSGEQQYSQSSLGRSGGANQLVYSYAGKIAPGKHTFTFSAGDWSKDFGAEYVTRKNIWDNPTVVFLGVLSLLIFGIGTVLRRPEVLRYGLDIPDFPPLTTVKIPIKRETVLEIFDNVNAGYSWKWMPLRAEELKSGFRKLTYNGKPILIGDFNLERVLSKLREEGSVKDELDYWGKAAWEKESGHSTRYLMIYRILRNVFVNNAVKFSKIDAIPECDVKAVLGNEEIYFHVMEEPRERVAHRALATVPKGHTIIVFKTPEEADDFRRALNSPSKLAVALKMEVNNKNILLLPVKEAVSAYLKGIGG
ncbi:MAG: hypothetical protein WC861_01470 [Candidatus Micrarchaeia archaeon]|jgi:hypothetical protein